MDARIVEKHRDHDLRISWLSPRDRDDAEVIQLISFGEHENLQRLMKRRDTVVLAAYKSGRVVGVLRYTLRSKHVTIDSVAVDPTQRFKGIGKSMVLNVLSRLDPKRRWICDATVRDTDTSSQFFFSKCGFMAYEQFSGKILFQWFA